MQKVKGSLPFEKWIYFDGQPVRDY